MPADARMPDTSRPHYRHYDELAHLEQLVTPLWVFDVDRHAMWWGNQSALKLWKTDSVEALCARDFSSDSESVRRRLRGLVELPHGGGSIQDTWTLYPQAEPVTIELDLRPVLIEEGRNAILVEASPPLDLSDRPDSLRILEAARSSAFLVSTFTLSGQLLSQNPAAHECYSHLLEQAGNNSLAARFATPGIADTILQSVAAGGGFQAELEVNTTSGPRVHQVNAGKGRDPITGQFVTVINEEDRTEQARLRQDLEALNQELEGRVAARTAELERANQQLRREIDERQAVEEKLRQAQRMEAIGQLTGGIAHDFNNILAVIMGNLDLIDTEQDRDGSVEIMRMAVERGSVLTQRLLAYSRKQSLNPKALRLDQVINRSLGLLRGALGEAIEIEVTREPDAWPVLVDQGQLESAIMNMALNARDAMPGGGRLTLHIHNQRVGDEAGGSDDELTPGDYGVLTLRDDGQGMTEQVQSQAFEPFFTTKDVGQGSGLGLSMVYGFARQSGGTVTLTSRVGAGTELNLFLPRSCTDKAVVESGTHDANPGPGGETVLVVEDNGDLLTIIRALLIQLGYRVLTAPDAAAARDHLARDTAVDLVLSDVMLPNGASGPEFIAGVRENYPALKVVFMSGYPRESLRDKRLGTEDELVLFKPFNARELDVVLRKALDTPQNA